MNRIALAEESVVAPTKWAGSHGLVDVESFSRRRAVREASEPFATFTPIHYEPGYAYPLLVWLHSAGGHEHELRNVMPLVSMRNYVAIAPRGSTADRRHNDRYNWRQTHDDIELAESRVIDSIDAAQRRFNIHAQRIFLAGCGSGGTMALRIAWNDPNRFAGVAAFNGPLPNRFLPLHRVNEVRRVPCLLATCRENQDYPPEQVCADLRLLHAAGCTVALRQYPGPDLMSNMLADLDRWLMELVCGAGTRAESRRDHATFQFFE